MEIKDGIRKWDNPVTMRCSCESSKSRMGEEMFPGGYGHGCHEPAHFVEVKNGEVVKFFCFSHGMEAQAK